MSIAVNQASLYIENYFSSLPVYLYLKDEMKLNSLGTLRSNRIADGTIEIDKIPQEKWKCIPLISVVNWVVYKVELSRSTLNGIQPEDRQ